MVGVKPVLYIVGMLYCILAASMLIPMLIDLHNASNDWKVFMLSALMTGFVGSFLIISNKQEKVVMSIKQAILLTPLSWFTMAIFSALPFYMADIDLSFPKAYFEAVSGLTTSGGTVISGLDNAPKGILMWRAILQYLGGLGIIVMALIILPALGVGGMQIFKNESFNSTDKYMARSSEVAKSIFMVYTLICALATFCFYQAGMSLFDAICHAIFSVATGGFSNYDASIAHFNSFPIELICVIFMILGSFPFILYYKMLGGDFKSIFKSSQVKTFLAIIFVSSLVLALWINYHNLLENSVSNAPQAGTLAGFLISLRHTLFNIVSVISSSGFASTDYNSWGPVAQVIFILVMMIGGCTGSTAGGIKVFRIQVLSRVINYQLKKLVSPHGVFRPRYHQKTIEDDVLISVCAYVFLYVTAMIIGGLLLAMTGLDFVTAITAAPAMLSNVGPSLGNVSGPVGNYSSFSDAAVWMCSLLMILGRLEFLVILVLMTPTFWRE